MAETLISIAVGNRKVQVPIEDGWTGKVTVRANVFRGTLIDKSLRRETERPVCAACGSRQIVFVALTEGVGAK